MPVLEGKGDAKYQHQLPTVSFRVITDDKSLLAPAGVHSEQSRHFGYNDFSDFERPEHYIRYIEPIESELAVQVEYDMDEQDQEWLDTVNAERKKDQSGPISYEVFEIIMDKLEKEWFSLIKRIPQPASHLPVEDSKCSICDDGEGENSNAIVFCDGCNLAVHQDCYGVPYIPEGQWLCRKCTVSPENPVLTSQSCLFCPNEGGAFKQTTTGHWAHLLCAIWIPELGVGNAIYMEPVEGVEQIPKNRWKLICSICRERMGACIQCTNRNCFTAFHVTCARQMGLLMSMKSLGTEGQLIAYCEKHLPADSRVSREDDTSSDFSMSLPHDRNARKGSHNLTTTVTTKTARAHAKSYRPGPPIVPMMIVQRLLEYVARISIRKRQQFIERLCRYWSLKREARRGAPLLKRLHLEPWTASSSSRQETEAEKAKKLQFLSMLRSDLEKVRMLAERVRKREKEKLRQTQILKDIVDGFIFPHYAMLRLTLEKISAMDRQELFLHPVSRAEVPDYFDIIKEPMSWLQMDEKIEKTAYRHVADFKRDVMLVLDNAMIYNAADSLFHRTAKRIKTNAQPLLDELDAVSAVSQLVPEDTAQSGQIPHDIVGDLEPSLVLLSALSHRDPSDETRDMLGSLFAFELEKPKEPTPPPPSPKKRKDRSHAERKRMWEERQAKAKERAGTVRATRASDAVTKAFVAEAGVQSDVEPSRGSAEPRSRRSARADTESSDVRRQNRPQVGVAGVQAVAVMTDRERREAERALELNTDGVDGQDLFRRFNVGWVLPEGSKRKRAERSEPAKSISRKEKTSTSSATARSEPAASQAGPSGPSGRSAPAYLRSSPLSAPPSSGTLTPPSSERRSPAPVSPELTDKGKGKGKAPREESELEDTIEAAPETRKRKAPRMSVRASKKRKEATSEPEGGEEMMPVPNRGEGGGSREGASEDVEMENEEDEQEAQEEKEAGEGESEDADVRTEVKEENESDGDDPYPPGTLVWAKLPSYPFFPAQIVDPTRDPEDIGEDVLAQRPKIGKSWLVRFFDVQESFGWVGESKLDMLGEDNVLDGRYLAGKEKNRSGSFRSTNMKKACAKAYRDAMAARDVEEEEQEQERGQEQEQED